MSQSPVDIAASVSAELPPLEFDYFATPLVVENTGHVIEVRMPEDSDHTLTIGDDAYRLVQYHFHAPSEHMIDGESFDLEAHSSTRTKPESSPSSASSSTRLSRRARCSTR